jgi:hypothetical protein
MQITQEELNRRLNSTKNLSVQLNASSAARRGNDANNRNNSGRKAEVPNAPASLRLVAGICARADGNSCATARELDLTSGQVRYAAGAKETKLTVQKVQEVALSRLMDSLGLLNPDEISGEKPKDISIIAANLSRVHSNLRSKDDRAENAVNITIYSPQLRRVDEFECIEVQSA